MFVAARVRDYAPFPCRSESDRKLLNAGLSSSSSAVLIHRNLETAVAAANLEAEFSGKRWCVWSLFTGVSSPFDPNQMCFISDEPMKSMCMLVYATLPTEPFRLPASCTA